MQIKISFSEVMVIVILFLLMYRPIIFGFSASYYLLLVMIFMLLCSKNILINKRDVSSICFPVFFVITYILTVMFLDNTTNEVLISLINLAISFFVTLGLFSLPFSRKISQTKLLDMIMVLGVIQSSICIIMRISPAIHRLLAVEAVDAASIDVFRNYGLAGPSEFFYGIGLVHGFLSLTCFTKLLEEKKNKYIFNIFLLLVPCYLDTRTGLLCFIAATFALIAFNKDFIFLLLHKKYLLSILCILILFLFKTKGSAFFFNFHQFIEAVEALLLSKTDTKVYEWYGGLIPSNWILPNGIDFLFGTGGFDNNNTYMFSGVFDSGYYRMIYVGGVVLIIMSVFFVMYYLQHARLSARFKLATFIFIIVALIKGNALVSCSFMCTVLLIVEYMDKSSQFSKKIIVSNKNIPEEL